MTDKKIVSLENAIGYIALGTYLSDWNDGKSYDEVMEYLNELESCGDADPDEVSVWEKFEDDDPECVTVHISNLHWDVKNLLTNVLTEIKTGLTTIEDVLKTLKGI